MNLWQYINYGAWALTGLMLFAMLNDFIKVERQRKADSGKEAAGDVR